MTKRIARIAIAAAAAATIALPAAPAQASCISLITTPVDCVKQALAGAVSDCVYVGTFDIVCLPSAS